MTLTSKSTFSHSNRSLGRVPARNEKDTAARSRTLVGDEDQPSQMSLTTAQKQ
jgi:hypothetical protein